MLDPKCFEGKSALVTGAASGIGAAAAIELASLGASVAMVDINPDGLRQTEEAIKQAGRGQCLCLPCDASDPAAIDQAVAKTVAAFGGINFLVNVAGILRRTAFKEIPLAEWDLMMAVNLRGPYLFCQAVVPIMAKAGGGSIVNVASLAGRTCSVLGGVHYTTAKHAMVGMSRHMARELGPEGIRVNAFCPGATATPMIMNDTPAERLEAIEAALPRRKIATPEEQARVIAFLLSPLADNLLGVALDSNGGALMI